MKLIERYIFKRVLWSLLTTLLSLSATVWLSQALREFDLVTARGQTLLTFLKLTGLLMPTLVMIIGPVAMMVAVAYVLNMMNSDSELAIINASGARQTVVLKPVMAIAVGLTLSIASMTLYFAPLAQRSARDMLTAVNSDLIGSVLREGAFLQAAKGLTIHIKRRNPDRTMDGIFVFDARERDQRITYVARRGAVIDNPLGMFLVMQDGVIQRENPRDKAISLIEFQSYAFDLSSLSQAGAAASYTPSERTTAELLAPDPADPQYQRFPGRFRSELHDRLASPLYALVFALVPVAFLGRAQTTRRGRGLAIAGATSLSAAIRGLGFMLTGSAAANSALIPALYLLPLGAILLSLMVIFDIVRPRAPRRLVTLSDRFTEWVASLVRSRAAASGSR